MSLHYSRARQRSMTAARKRQDGYWARKCGPVRVVRAEKLSPAERAKYAL